MRLCEKFLPVADTDGVSHVQLPDGAQLCGMQIYPSKTRPPRPLVAVLYLAEVSRPDTDRRFRLIKQGEDVPRGSSYVDRLQTPAGVTCLIEIPPAEVNNAPGE